ncbi:FliH/SctL family protein [Leifsonia sp. A12D58]|uniref:FliH/SctL family protein n=1 Tax=Leifsonia sp. A12D58 TaxID=3397674 RepID=UPI0039DFAFAB
MFTDPGFAAVTFPTLRGDVQERVEAQAKARGHAAGFTEGLRQAKAEADAALARQQAEHQASLKHDQARTDRAIQTLNQAAAALQTRTVPVLDEAKDVLAHASIAIVEAILGYELGDAPRSARAALARAFAGENSHAVHTVRLHPDDLGVLQVEVRDRADVTFLADPSLSRGDAVAEYPDGFLDARISTALARATSALLEENRQ